MHPEPISRWIRDHAWSWLVSLALHAAILGPLCLITWAVTSAVSRDQVLTLAPAVAGVGADDGDGVGNGLGNGGGGAGGDVPNAGGSGGAVGAPAPGAMPFGAGLQGAPGTVGMPGGALPDATGASPLAGTLADMAPPAGAGTGGNAGGGGGDPFGTLVNSLAGTGRGMGTGTGSGIGPGMLEGTSPGFRGMVGGLRGRGLDIVLVMDATDSMTPYYGQIKKRCNDIISIVTGLVPKARFGVVAFKGYGDEYGRSACRSTPLTDKAGDTRKFVDAITPGGGGDIPEAIHEALRVATDRAAMGWRPRRCNVIVLITDAPVQSAGRQTAFALAREFAGNDLAGTINVLDTGGTGTGDPNAQRKNIIPDLLTIASEGKGSAFLLQDEQAFWRHLIVSIFGERYRQDVETIVEKYTVKQN